MPVLTILPFDKQISFTPGPSLLDLLRTAGFQPESPCNGKGICGKCKVTLADPDAAVPTAHKNISPDETREGVRLACQVFPESDLKVTVPENLSLNARILEGQPLSGLECAPAVSVRKTDSGFFFKYESQKDETPLLGWSGDLHPLGAAIDIGTTTCVVSVYDLATGAHLATKSAINPQTKYGHDVLTRIQMGSEPEGLDTLAKAVAGELNRLISDACHSAGVDAKHILDVVLGGNTTMLQLAGKFDPEPLGHLPFEVGIPGGTDYPAERFGLDIHAEGRVYVPPIVHAFVGTDITAGLLAVGFFDEKDPALFIDIGTNGEMAIAADGRIIVTSTAAGPAFEGMGVSCGVRAAPGALEAAWKGDEGLEFRTVDEKPVNGICGSGIIDLIAVLHGMGVIESSGLMQPDPDGKVSEKEDGRQYEITPKVFLSQGDIRQIQLAKGAIRTGIDMLVKAAGLEMDRIQKVVLAGAFGYHLKPASLEAIGLLPPKTAGKVMFSGNTSKTGAAMMLINAALRKKLETQAAGATHLALADKPEFQDLFIENLSLP